MRDTPSRRRPRLFSIAELMVVGVGHRSARADDAITVTADQLRALIDRLIIGEAGLRRPGGV